MQTTAQIKKSNCLLLKTALRKMISATKYELAKATGLSQASSNNLINEMVQTGEMIVREQVRNNDMGRPSYTYQLNDDFSHFLCLFLEKLNDTPTLRATIHNLAGTIVAQESQPWNDEDVHSLTAFIDSLLKKVTSIRTIGISIQGVVRKNGQIACCDAKKLTGLNLKQLLSETYQMPIVCENDMNLLAYGLLRNGQFEKNGSIAVLAQYSAVPPGAGVIVDGHILHGSTDFAGEVSFLPCTKESACSKLLLQILSLITVANPASISLVGDTIQADTLSTLQMQIDRYIPKEHQPQLFYIDSPFAHAQRGLLTLCMEGAENKDE